MWSHQHVTAMAYHLVRQVLHQLAHNAATAGAAVAPGQIYLVDHSKATSAFLALRLRQARGQDAPVATVRLRPGMLALEVHLLATPAEAEAICQRVGALRPQPIKRGRFQSTILATRATDLEGLAGELVAQAEEVLRGNAT